MKTSFFKIPFLISIALSVLAVLGGITSCAPSHDLKATIHTDNPAQIITILKNRIEAFGVTNPRVIQDGQKVLLSLPNFTDRAKVMTMLDRPVTFAVKELEARTGVPFGPSLLTQDDVEYAVVQLASDGRPVIAINIKSERAAIFEEATRSRIGQSLAILVDGKLKTKAAVSEAIGDGLVIAGFEDYAAALDVSNLIRASYMPTEYRIEF